MAVAVATPLANAVVSKVANDAVDSVWHQIGYIWNYKSNIQDLEQQLLKLKAERLSMLHCMDEAKKNAEEIEDTATIWLKSADDAIHAAEELLQSHEDSRKSCFVSCCPNLMTRHQYSRKAKKETPVVAQVQQERNSIHIISRGLDVQTVEPVKSYVALESRKKVLRDIAGVLKNGDVNLIGVYGLGGVGKSTLVKQQVIAQVKEEGIFKVVAIANVTHSWDLSKIQREIADWLGLKLDIESSEVRAARLRARLKQEEKVLIVLDDIWERIELEKIGIPNLDDHKGCKILMTSRDLTILLNMGVQRHFLVEVLSKEEEWQLFKRKAGDFKNFESESIAIEVAKRCAGLPVLVVAVATSLRDKELYEWKDALEHLQKFDDKGMDSQVYSALELSYNFLSEDQKSLLILCAQAGGSTISISNLMQYAIGLGLFHKCTTLKVLENRVLKVVNDLKRSCLLLEGEHDNIVRMHDVVLSFAIVIATKQYHVFTLASQTELQEWPDKNTFKLCTAISLPHCIIPDLPQVLECPKLESFIFYNDDPSLKIPDKFFSRTKKCKLVDLSNVNLSPKLPLSLGILQNLQTLRLSGSILDDTSAIGQLHQLQVLSLARSNIVQLPMEISNLTRLLVLDLSECRRLEVIPPGILICLTKLEGLAMLGSFVQWEGEGCTSKRNNASLSELKTLSNLTHLEIHISDAKIMPDGLFHEGLEEFRILIGDNWDFYGDYDISKMLKLKLNVGYELERVKVLLLKTEGLYLDDLTGLENVVPKLERQGFPNLKLLQIQNCHEMTYIIDSTGMVDIITFSCLESLSLLNLNKLENICYRPLISRCFNNLKKLKVGNCNALKNLFSFDMFRCLVQLQEIMVSECRILKEIVAVRYEDETIKLTQLQTLTLEGLPELQGFCCPTNKASAEIDESENLFSRKIQFPNLVELKLSSINVEKIWHNHNIEFCPLDKLTTFVIQGCGNFSSALTSSMVRSLAQLKIFEICDCKSMEEVIRIEGETQVMIFPKLNYLKLEGLPNVVKFCRANLIQCPSMELLSIVDCPRLQTFVSTSDADSSTLFDEKVDFPILDRLRISEVNRVTEIWGNELCEGSFHKLKQLLVEYAEEVVKVFPHNLELRRFQNLEELVIFNCDALTNVFDIRAPIDVKIQRGGVAVSQLKTLWVWNNPKLKHVWNKDPKAVLEFQNLSNVGIRGCQSLKSVFPASVARGLLHLEKFEVWNSAIKEIVAGDEERIQGASVFEFPRLEELNLRRLPELETFYPGIHTSEWPALKALFITECDQFHLPTTFHEMVQIIPNLEELALNDKSIRIIRESELPVELFYKLKLVEFNFFNEKSAVFPYDLLHMFHNLETLRISVSRFKELFPPEKVFVHDEKHPLILTKMHSLELYELPNLETIWNQVLQTLKSLLIRRCDNLIILAPSSASFPSLTSLDILACKGLVSLVTSSTAKSLIQLKNLKIRKCDRMKVVVSDEGDEMINEINFIKLKFLELDGLPSLTSFCAGNHNFKFPSLIKVVVNQCPKMEFFSKGVSSTSMLAGVQSTEDKNREDWLGDLNSTMHFLYKKMVGFCGVQHLKVSEFSNLRDRWHNELPVEFLCDLESLVIDEVAFSSYAMPSNLLEYLNKLQDLSVTNCEVLEEVFDVRGLSAEHDILSRLNKFQLISLPRLRNIWNEHTQGILNFKRLTSLKVHHCSSLKTIFTPSMTQGLVQLQEMEVKYCNSVEEIITRGAANEVIKEIIFPLLQSIILESLPCLISFNSGREILKCPSLEEIAIVDCPTTFTCTFLRDLQSNPDDGISEPKVVFPNLKDLKLSNLVKIQKIWYNKQQLEISAFTENLTSLNIDGCGNLKHLFSTSMVKVFIHLKTLEVCNCKFMEEIIHMENNGKIGDMVLRKLEFVKLQNLQQLSQFCTGNFIECVGLTMLWIEDCPELGAFISKSAISNNLNSTCSPEIVNSTLFDKKVDFPNLETLIISGVNGLKEIWDNELREDSFCKLKGLKVKDAKAVVKVFPPNVDRRRFQNLEELYIHGCDALTEVFDIRALIDLNIERGGVIATQLRKLQVLETPNLEHIWNEDPKGILDFHNLSNVGIQGCPSLKSVVPASIARALVHLECFYVFDSAIKEIVARDEERLQGGYVFHFPQLKELILRRLPQLERFYPETHTSEWPTLQKICITECYQFQHSALSFKKIIPNLMELALNSKEVKMIHEGQLPTELFRKLRVVEFDFFNEKSAVFPFSLLHILPNLETLKVSRSQFKELFPPEGVFVRDENHPKILTRMHSLELYCLPNLKTMWNQVFQTLETLYIEGCDSLIILAPSSASFRSLTSLNIYNCKGLVSLVTLSSAASLTRLQILRVTNCNQVKVIVSDEGDETMDEINFIKLKTLVLDCLPSLSSFCLANHSFKFPSLTKVVVKQCPGMEFFSKGVSVTPMLQSVQLTEDGNGGDWLGDLNLTISFLYNKMVGFRGLQYLKLSKFSNLIDRWHNELPGEFFCGLNSLVIDEVAFSSCAIPSNLLEYLNKLDKLEVTNCELLEEVFHRQGLSDDAEGQRVVLSMLKNLHLINLPKLSQVWNEHPRRILNFKHLKSLKVHNCCSLRMIFIPSMTQQLVQLQEIEVKNCHSVEEIISNGAEEDDTISFPQLNSLVLDSLPKLTVFRTGKGIVQCPSLEKITVMDCPNIEVLTSSAEEDQEPIKSDGNSIFFGKVTCESLKELRVDWSNNMKKISDGESAATHDFFSSLKVLELKHIPTEYSIFPSRFLERSPNLEELIASDSSFEELFSEEGTVNEEESSKKVTHLRRLTLSTLPLLRHLIKDRIELACSFFQHLKALEVFECNKITILAPSFISFRNLTTLKVSKCHGLLNLITSSTARSMTRLTRLEITECKMVEEIVVSEGDHEVEAEIGFSQLKHLQLHCLPKLTRFGSGNGTFNFPSLEEVIVRQCPGMEIFVQGELSAPNLESVQTTEDENEWRWDGSLNATIQKLFEETIAEKIEEH